MFHINEDIACHARTKCKRLLRHPATDTQLTNFSSDSVTTPFPLGDPLWGVLTRTRRHPTK